MMAPIFYKPGQGLKTYEVFRKKAKLDSRGRVTVETQPELIDAVRGTIARASQKEQELWNQRGHPITHTIVIRGRTKAEAGDELRLFDRAYHVQGKHDPVGVGFFSTLYCLERLGVSPEEPGGGEGENP